VVDNQHQKIKGYRDLSEEEIAMMNDIKSLGEALGLLVGDLEGMPDTDKRWVAIGKTDLQKGIMALVRSVAKPESF
jgi:hypothetical protein